jgi:reactive intermediate/imine deaminase
MRISLLIAGLLGASCGQGPAEISDEEIKFISTDDLKTSGLPLSTAVEVDGWIFLSGALGTIPGEGLAKGGIGPETRQTMENIQATLAGEGLGMDRIVKCTAMLADMSEWPAFNSIYKEFFDADYPARSAFAANGLAANARVEIECIARR